MFTSIHTCRASAGDLANKFGIPRKIALKCLAKAAERVDQRSRHCHNYLKMVELQKQAYALLCTARENKQPAEVQKVLADACNSLYYLADKLICKDGRLENEAEVDIQQYKRKMRK